VIIRTSSGNLIGIDKNSKEFYSSIFSFAQNLEELVAILNELEGIRTISFEKRFQQIMESNKK